MGIIERKKRDFEHREQVILGAALSLFNSDDWLSVTVDQLADKAEIGKGTVYKHFANKEEIYARLTLDFYYGLLEGLESVDFNRMTIPVLGDIFMFALRYHLAQPEFRRVTQYCKRIDFKQRSSEKIREAFDKLDADFRALVGKLISRGMQENEIPQANVKHLYYCMRACFDGSVDTVWTGYIGLEKIDIEEYIQVITRFMLAGVLGLGNIENNRLVNLNLT
jgi:AcrR family transcriptional regulator